MVITNRIKIIIISLPLLIFVGVVIAFCTNYYLDARAGEKFYSVNFNDTEASVVALLGKPDVIESCPINLWWDLEHKGKNNGECVTQVRYNYFLSSWSFGYSSAGTVISKYHYASE
jgi:hypothetical protein